jgi:tetratricopeptide (TPR) repeat protein
MARLNPNNADVQFTLAVLLMGQKQPEAALTALEAAAQLRPRDQNIQELLIKALARLGRWEQVTDAALAQIKEYPGKAALALKLYPQLTKHRPQGAAILLEAAGAGGAKDPRLYELQAALALDQDDTARAIKTPENGAQVLSDNLEIKLRLADLYEAAGHNEKSLHAYEAILDRDPGYAAAQEPYLKLKTRLLDAEGTATPSSAHAGSTGAGPGDPVRPGARRSRKQPGQAAPENRRVVGYQDRTALVSDRR